MLISCVFSVAQAVTYSNAINESSWRAHTSVFECRLEHNVPYYGRAVFSTRAGEASKFYLRARSSRFSAGEAEVLAKSPVWKPHNESFSLAKVTVKRGRTPMWLGSQNAEKMLAELNKGMEIAFVRNAWYTGQNQPALQLAISTIGFRGEYKRYLKCLSGLLPANFDQLKRTALYFEPGFSEEKDELHPAITRQLDKVLKLVKHDNKIRRFYIDGHTSSPGDRAENLELSKLRAEMVADYLKRRGIPENWIILRWHGERYPAASNETSVGRAKNRRVTMRLERVEAIEVLPLASD